MTEKWKIAYKRFSDRDRHNMSLTTETRHKARKHYLKAKLNLALFMDKNSLPPDVIQNVIEILYYVFGVATNWIVRILSRKKQKQQ